MLDFMRQKKTSVVSYFIFGIIIIVFAISFGPGATNPGGTVQGVIATVGDKSVTEMEFKAKYSLAFQRYKSMFPGFDSEMAKNFNLKRVVLDQLVNQLLLSQYAGSLGLSVGNDELRDYIKSTPSFKNEDGNFDPVLYEKIINYYYRQNTGKFEDSLRDEILAGKVRTFLRSTVYIPESELVFEFNRQNHKKKFAFVRVNKTDYVKENPLEISEDDKSSFLEKNNDRVKASYETNKSSYEIPEKVEASHILIKVKDGERSEEEAKKLSAEIYETVLKDPSKFAEIAGEKSDDPGSKSRGGELGAFARGMMVPAFEAAAFGMKENEISKPIKTNFGFHIIKVTKKIAAVNKSFDDVKMSIVSDLIQKEALDLKIKEQFAAFLEAVKADPKANLNELLPEAFKGKKYVSTGTTSESSSSDQFFGSLGKSDVLKSKWSQFSNKEKFVLGWYNEDDFYQNVWLIEEKTPDLKVFETKKTELGEQLKSGRVDRSIQALIKDLKSKTSVNENLASVSYQVPAR